MKKLFSLFLACVFAAALLGGCGPGTSPGKPFYTYNEFKRTFKTMFRYPTYFPKGHNFLKGEAEFYAAAEYIDWGGHWNPPAQTPDNFDKCYISPNTQHKAMLGEWETGAFVLYFPMEVFTQRLLEDMEKAPESYIQKEKGGYMVYQKEEHIFSKINADNPNDSIYVYFYFFLPEGVYACKFAAGRRVNTNSEAWADLNGRIYVDNVDGWYSDEDMAGKEALAAHFLEESVKVMDSLKPYGG